MRIPGFLQPLPDAALQLEGATRDALYRAARARILVALTLIYAFFYTTRYNWTVVSPKIANVLG